MGNLDAIEAIMERQEQARAAEREARKAARETADNSRPAPTGTGDAEIQAMNAEADLLGLVRADTGEQGRESAGRVDFHSCPVCGHDDCFTYYANTNSWTCFSTSNVTGIEGGLFTEYLKAAHGYTDVEAVKRLREETGHPYQQTPKDSPAERKPDSDGYMLPRWEHIRVIDPPKRNPVLIPGILRRGHVAVLVSKGKAGKSCSMMELAIATATGGEWFGRRIENGGTVLYLDPEIHSSSAHNRFSVLCSRMGADAATAEGRVLKWPLRGTAASIEVVKRDILHGIEVGELADLALIVVDSASIFIEGDENSSVDVRRFSAHLMEIASRTGASVVAVAHTGKAKDGDRDAADRTRGSSVWLDFPDALISLSETLPPSGEPVDYLGEGRFGCVLECGGLRQFGRFEPVRCIFDYPAPSWTWTASRTAGRPTAAPARAARPPPRATGGRAPTGPLNASPPCLPSSWRAAPPRASRPPKPPRYAARPSARR